MKGSQRRRRPKPLLPSERFYSHTEKRRLRQEAGKRGRLARSHEPPSDWVEGKALSSWKAKTKTSRFEALTRMLNGTPAERHEAEQKLYGHFRQAARRRIENHFSQYPQDPMSFEEAYHNLEYRLLENFIFMAKKRGSYSCISAVCRPPKSKSLALINYPRGFLSTKRSH